MATNTSKTYLYSGTDGVAYTKVCDITSYPDLYTAPGKLDATTLSDTQKVYVADIADVPDLTFGANYVETDYDAIKAFEGTSRYYQVWFGTAGADGKFTWQGNIFMTPKGGKVGGLREAEITCYPATAIVKS